MVSDNPIPFIYLLLLFLFSLYFDFLNFTQSLKRIVISFYVSNEWILDQKLNLTFDLFLDEENWKLFLLGFVYLDHKFCNVFMEILVVGLRIRAGFWIIGTYIHLGDADWAGNFFIFYLFNWVVVQINPLMYWNVNLGFDSLLDLNLVLLSCWILNWLDQEKI